MIKRTGLKRLLFTVVNSAKGFRFLARHEEAFQLESVLACLLIPIVIYLPATSVETVLLIISVIVVLIVELLNTAIEVLTDRISLVHHELSGLAKDLGSLSVTLSLALWVTVWGWIALQYSLLD